MSSPRGDMGRSQLAEMPVSFWNYEPHVSRRVIGMMLTSRSNLGISLLAARTRVVPLLLVLMAGLGIYSVSQVHLPVGAKLIIGAAIAGIALGPVLTVGKIGRVVALWVAAFLLLGFCVLAGFSVGCLFLPAAFALLSLAAVFGLSRTTAPD